MKLKEYKEKYKEDRFYQEVFEQEIYDPIKKLGDLDTVIDLGALGGEFSFWVYNQAKNIYAIEPVKEQYDELINNINDFEFTKVKPFRLAISDTQRMGHMANVGRGGQVLSMDTTSTADDISVMTLKNFMDINNIKNVDVLKIDIEDHERYVFNSPDFPEIAKDIKFIIGEHGADIQILGSLGFNYRVYKYGFIYER